MTNKKKVILLLGIVLGLFSFSCDASVLAIENVSELSDNESSQSDLKVDKDTPDKVSEYIRNKDYNSALPLVEAYITSKPKKYQGYKLRGEIYYALRQYNLAVRDFQKAIDIKTDNDKFSTNTKVISAVVLGADKQEQYQNPELGALYGELMYAQKAINDNMYEVSYKKALEYNSHLYLPFPKKEQIPLINCPQKYGKIFNPKGIDAEISSVIDDIENGKFSEAVYRLPAITGEYPNYYLGYYLTGVVMYGMEREDDAISAFEKSLELNPYDFESYASLGLLYYDRVAKTFDKLDAQKSAEYFEKALKLNPNCNTYYFYIGLTNLEMGNYELAIDNFKKAISVKTNDYNSMYYKSIALYLFGDYKGVIDETTKMLYRRVSNYNSVLYLRALAYYRLKDEESAVADIEKIHQNLNDIYNFDVKPLSKREEILDCYLYYLQSRISRDNGLGAKSDLEKAYKNPLIALLDTRKNDFEQANYKLTSSDIETQYEYLITTFSDLGVSFKYINPDYQIVSSRKNSDKVENTIVLATGTQPALGPNSFPDTNIKKQISEKDKTSEIASNNITKATSDEQSVIDEILALNDVKSVEELKPENKLLNSEITEELKELVSVTEKTDVPSSKPQEMLPNTQSEIIPNQTSDKKTEISTDAENNSIKESSAVNEDKKLEQPNVSILEKEILPSSVKEEKTDVVVYDSETLIFKDEKEKPTGNILTTQEVALSQNKEPNVGIKTQDNSEAPENITEQETSSQKVISDAITEEEKNPPVLREEIPIETKAENNITNEDISTSEDLKSSDIQLPATDSSDSLNSESVEKDRVTADVEQTQSVGSDKNITIPQHKINEKFTEVNLDDFDIKNRRTPDIKEDDEIVFLKTDSFIKKTEGKVDAMRYEAIANDNQNIKNETEANKPVEIDINPELPVNVNITKDSENLQNTTNDSNDENIPVIELTEPENIILPQIVKANGNISISEQVKIETAVNSTTDINPVISELVEPITKDEQVEISDSDNNVEYDKNSALCADKGNKNGVKKSKKKNKNNLITAVGGNTEDYEKQTKNIKPVKIKEEKKKLVPTNKSEDNKLYYDTNSSPNVAETELVANDDIKSLNLENPDLENNKNKLSSSQKQKVKKVKIRKNKSQKDNGVSFWQKLFSHKVKPDNNFAE